MIYDIILIIFIMALAWLGKRRGLFRSLMGFCSSIAAMLATAFFRQPVIEYMKTTPIYADAEKLIDGGISGNVTPDTTGMPKIFADAADSAGAAAGSAITQLIMAALVTVLLYLAITLVLNLFVGLLDGVFKLPVLRQFNSLGGFVFGAVSALLLVYAVLAVWGCFTAFKVPTELANTGLLKSLFENNLLMILFS